MFKKVNLSKDYYLLIFPFPMFVGNIARNEKIENHPFLVLICHKEDHGSSSIVINPTSFICVLHQNIDSLFHNFTMWKGFGDGNGPYRFINGIMMWETELHSYNVRAEAEKSKISTFLEHLYYLEKGGVFGEMPLPLNIIEKILDYTVCTEKIYEDISALINMIKEYRDKTCGRQKGTTDKLFHVESLQNICANSINEQVHCRPYYVDKCGYGYGYLKYLNNLECPLLLKNIIFNNSALYQ